MTGRFSNIMLVSDLDGTLLDKQSRVSPKNQAALEYFVENGGVFAIATGRNEHSAGQYRSVLPMNAPAILYNGAVIYDFATQTNLMTIGLPNETQQVVRELMVHCPEIGIQIYQSGETRFIQHNQRTVNERELLGWPVETVAIEQVALPWVKVLLIGEPEQLAVAETFLKHQPQSFRMVYSERYYLELLPLGVSKGQALQELAKLVGGTSRKTVAMGDNQNDLEMIAMADLGIAVANAHPEVKQAAKFCCGYHYADAVAEVVQLIETWLHEGNPQLAVG